MESQESSETTTEERFPWHKPEIQRLEVSLDTRYFTGSNIDGFSGSTEG